MLFDYFVVGDKMRVNNDKLDTKVMLEVLTPQTQKIIDDFLKHYKPISHRAYISAISNLFYVLGKDDASKLDIEDFRKFRNILEIKKGMAPKINIVNLFLNIFMLTI